MTLTFYDNEFHDMYYMNFAVDVPASGKSTMVN